MWLSSKNITGRSAFSSDLPGCVATGPNKEQVEKHMKVAIASSTLLHKKPYLCNIQQNMLNMQLSNTPPLTIK